MPTIHEQEQIGLLNRRIVVEKVKSVFNKTLKKSLNNDEKPPPLPPKTYQKPPLLPRPAKPPPLPPRKAPLMQQCLFAAPIVDPCVSELVLNFTKLQESVKVPSVPAKVYECSSISTISEVAEENNYEDFECFKHLSPPDPVQSENGQILVDPIPLPTSIDEPDNTFGFLEKPSTFTVDIIQPPEPFLTTENHVTFSTFKPKLDWKDAFFQPVKIKLERQGSTSKLPKIVEDILEHSGGKQCDSYKAETIKRSRVKVSDIVNCFEQKGTTLDEDKSQVLNIEAINFPYYALVYCWIAIFSLLVL